MRSATFEWVRRGILEFWRLLESMLGSGMAYRGNQEDQDGGKFIGPKCPHASSNRGLWA